MSEETTADVSELEETGQSSDEGSEQEPVTEQQATAFAAPALTADEIRKIVREETSRTMQSFTDRTEDQIAKRVDLIYEERSKAYKAAGVELSAAEAAQERKEIAREVIRDPELGRNAQTRSAPASDLPRRGQIATEQAFELLRNAGIQAHPYSLVDPMNHQTNPEGWLELVSKEIDKRKGAKQKEAEQPEETPGSAEARLGSQGEAGGDRKQQLLSELTQLQNKKGRPTHAEMKRRKEITEELNKLD